MDQLLGHQDFNLAVLFALGTPFPLERDGAQKLAPIPRATMQQEMRAAPGVMLDVRDSRKLQRRLQYEAGRACAAELLTRLGSREIIVATAPDRSPIWPHGFIGSITHTDHIVGVAVREGSFEEGLGIDLEPVVTLATVGDIQSVCLTDDECTLQPDCRLSHEVFSTICFSAKEALYKCLYPLTRVEFGFLDVEIKAIDPFSQTLQVCLQRHLSSRFPKGLWVIGKYQIAYQHVFTAFEI